MLSQLDFKLDILYKVLVQLPLVIKQVGLVNHNYQSQLEIRLDIIIKEYLVQWVQDLLSQLETKQERLHKMHILSQLVFKQDKQIKVHNQSQ